VASKGARIAFTVVTGVTDRREKREQDSGMAQSVLCTDCPECNSEILVDLGTAHRLFGDSEKLLYRVVCMTCGLAYDVHFEDLLLREKPDDELTKRNRISTFPRA
jgi:hypothetical protein